jgi:proton glutamate symport protein
LKASPRRILIGLVLGGALGFLCARSRSPLLLYIPGLVAPVGTLFLNCIRVCVIPLITGGLIVGCASSHNNRRIGTLAGKSLVVILCYLCIAAVFAGALAFPIFRHLTGSIGLAQQTASPNAAPARLLGFGLWVGKLVPSNLFKAAVDGDILPLIVLSIAFGLTVSRMPGEQRDLLLRLFRAFTDAFTRLIQVVLLTAPIGVFCLAVGLAAVMGLGGARALVVYVAVLSTISAFFILAVLYPSVAIFSSVPLSSFLRAGMPAQAMAFTSRSSLAALPATYYAASEGLSMSDEISCFFFPFAASIFRVGGCIAQMAGVCFLASFYSVPLSWNQLAGVGISAVAVSLTVPGIPGGAIIVMTPILTSLHIPLSGMAMLLAVDTIPDMFRTTANVTGWLAAGAILTSRKQPLQEAAGLDDQTVGEIRL